MKKPKLIYPIIIHATNTISDLPVILDDIKPIYSDDRYSPSRKGTNIFSEILCHITKSSYLCSEKPMKKSI